LMSRPVISQSIQTIRSLDIGTGPAYRFASMPPADARISETRRVMPLP
jgi:hypothetical protein